MNKNNIQTERLSTDKDERQGDERCVCDDKMRTRLQSSTLCEYPLSGGILMITYIST